LFDPEESLLVGACGPEAAVQAVEYFKEQGFEDILLVDSVEEAVELQMKKNKAEEPRERMFS